MRDLRPLFLLVPLLLVPACTTPAESSGSGGGGGATACEPGAVEACYPGPASTEDVGACHAGTRTCAADGSAFGACEGAVLPQPMEGCVAHDDLDCDGYLAACLGASQWKLPLGGDLEPAAIAASSDDEATLVGWAHTIDLGSGPQGDPATWSLVVARIGADGSARWLRTFPGVDAAVRSARVVMTEAHEAVLTLRVEGQPTIEGATLDAAAGAVLALRFADDGALTTAKLLDLSGPDGALPVSPKVARIDGDGVLLGGEGFLARIDATLQTTWHHRYAGDIAFMDIATGADGARFATGFYEGDFEPGGKAESVLGHHAGFIARLEGDGIAWSEKLGGDVETAGLSLLVNEDGNLRIAGIQDGKGALVDYIGVDGWTAFVADRNEYGLIDSTFMGWGPRRPEGITIDRNGDILIRAMASASGQPSVIFKAVPTTTNALWAEMFPSPPVSVTLFTGETIVATATAVQMLGR